MCATHRHRLFLLCVLGTDAKLREGGVTSRPVGSGFAAPWVMRKRVASRPCWIWDLGTRDPGPKPPYHLTLEASFTPGLVLLRQKSLQQGP